MSSPVVMEAGTITTQWQLALAAIRKKEVPIGKTT
tara:strand:+ start:860 stop:964 length:105 start_codon:yes stop_codon:yes gene_type:complete